MDRERVVPGLDVRLAPTGWRMAWEEAGEQAPHAHYEPPNDEHDGRVALFDSIAAQPVVLAHEALHHVLHHVVGREASVTLDHFDGEDPAEYATEGMVLLTPEDVEAEREDH